MFGRNTKTKGRAAGDAQTEYKLPQLHEMLGTKDPQRQREQVATLLGYRPAVLTIVFDGLRGRCDIAFPEDSQLTFDQAHAVLQAAENELRGRERRRLTLAAQVGQPEAPPTTETPAPVAAATKEEIEDTPAE